MLALMGSMTKRECMYLAKGLPSLNEFFSIIRVDEERRIAMLDSPTTENSAFVTIKSNGSVPYSGSGASNKTRRNEQTNQDNLWCAYCKSQDIPRRIVENLMENCHSSLEEIVVTEMLNLDNRMDKSTLCILNTTLTRKTQLPLH